MPDIDFIDHENTLTMTERYPEAEMHFLTAETNATLFLHKSFHVEPQQEQLLIQHLKEIVVPNQEQLSRFVQMKTPLTRVMVKKPDKNGQFRVCYLFLNTKTKHPHKKLEVIADAHCTFPPAPSADAMEGVEGPAEIAKIEHPDRQDSFMEDVKQTLGFGGESEKGANKRTGTGAFMGPLTDRTKFTKR